MMQPPLRILLVEDRDADAVLIQRELGNLNVITERVVRAEEALARLRGDPPYANSPHPDLILLDLRLPGMSGHDLLEEIKQNPQWRSIIVVALSVSTEEEDIGQAYHLHLNSYLVKPLDFQQFREMLAALVTYWGIWNERPPRTTP